MTDFCKTVRDVEASRGGRKSDAHHPIFECYREGTYACFKKPVPVE